MKVCLDEEGNLDNCDTREVDKVAENNTDPGMEEQFVGFDYSSTWA